MANLERQVGASTDDVGRRLTTSYWSVTVGANWAGGPGADKTMYKYGSGMRFTNITIPQGATITAAYLTLRSSHSYSGTTVNTRISAEDVDDAATFADDAAAFDTRWADRTTARVDWDSIPAWTQDTDYDSPEIKTVIQEVINRANWSSGNDIVIFWEDFDDRSSHNFYANRRGYSYNESADYAPKLTVTYTVPSGPANLKSYNGLAIASMKSIMGLGIADVKSVNGVS